MNSEDIFKTLLFLLEVAIICIVCYYLAHKICYSTKYKGEKKAYLKVLIANIICFLFFLIYGLLENHFYLGIKFLAPIWFLLFPVSLIFGIIFSYLFFSTKNDNSENKDER